MHYGAPRSIDDWSVVDQEEASTIYWKPLDVDHD